jgi:chemotaxis protein MotA
LDKGTIAGIALAAAVIVVGLLVEGGKVSQIMQPTAAMIVFGGTIGAVMVQFPVGQFVAATRALASIFVEPPQHPEALISELVDYAKTARKRGIVALDAELDHIDDPFLKRSLMLAVDGTAPSDLRAMMELELENQSEADEKIPQVFEAAGGFAPTVGIIGAVLGLIQVMQHLQNIDEVGRGIAVAFVATIYGVGAANLFFLPAAGKLRIRLRESQRLREMTLEGIISVLEGMNPRLLEMRLVGFIHSRDRASKRKSA